MHELSLVNNLLNKLDAISKENNAKIVSIKIRVGALSHITPERLKEYLLISEKTKDVKIEIVRNEQIDENAQDIILESVELAEE
ncbi:MAG: hydrogenase/urease maturation nickel metallochaperone HypA [Candidatus Nitrosocaldaceae archaeon]